MKQKKLYKIYLKDIASENYYIRHFGANNLTELDKILKESKPPLSAIKSIHLLGDIWLGEENDSSS